MPKRQRTTEINNHNKNTSQNDGETTKLTIADRTKMKESNSPSTSKTNPPSANPTNTPTATPISGLSVIDELFAKKKMKKEEHVLKEKEQEKILRQQEQSRTKTKKNNNNHKMTTSHNKLTYTRQDLALFPSQQQWMEDGLGGKFNKDGYTGRIQDGVKIFKAHLFHHPHAGNTPECPFDCQCCHI